MTKGHANRFKRSLEAKRDELLGEINERRGSLAIDHASDPMDQMRSIADRDLAVRNVDQMYRVLRLVNGALREIREGTFGLCAHCGADIAVKRLEAVPWSPYCVSCQEGAEQSGREQERAESATAYAG